MGKKQKRWEKRKRRVRGKGITALVFPYERVRVLMQNRFREDESC